MKFIRKLVIILTLLLLTACSEVRHYTAYTIYPVGFLLNEIGGNRISTISIQNSNVLVEKSTVINDLEDVLNDSIYLFHVGDLEPYLEVYDNEITDSGVKKVDLSLLNQIYRFQRYTRIAGANQETYIESPYYDGDVFDDIDTLEYDLYLWLDPSGMLSMSKDVYDVLSNNYVEQATYFKTNYDNLYSKLTTLEASYQALSTKLKNEDKAVKFVSMTSAFGSWQKSYGFSVYPVCLSRYGTLPTNEQLINIKNRIVKDNVHYIVYEPNMTDEMYNLMQQIEAELNLTRVNLSNLSCLTTSQQEDGKDYFSIMYDNLTTIENMAEDVNVTPVVEEVIEEADE